MNIYIHIPFCLKKCHYCVFPVHIIGKSQENKQYFQQHLQELYVKALLSDINHHYRNERVSTLYFGGGTPSLLDIKSLEQILHSFNIDQETEITIEADPGTFDLAKLSGIKDLGFNRLSVGVQSLNQDTLFKLNRSHTLDDTLKALDYIQKVYHNYLPCSFDVLYDLPDTMDHSEDTLTQVIKYKPGHISLYSVEIQAGSYFYDKLNYRQSESKFGFPTIQQQAQKFIQYHHSLTSAGYNQYEVSNFALEAKYESRHNKCYWEGNKDFSAFGMGAASLKNQQRITRPQTLKKYFDFVEQQSKGLDTVNLLNIEDESQQFEQNRVLLMSRLRTQTGLHKSLLSNRQMDFVKSLSDLLYIDEKDFVKLKIPNGFLVCDEVVVQLSNLYE